MSIQLPKGWKYLKLGEAVDILDNLRKPINSSERKQRIANKEAKELFPYYGATGQVGWIDDFIINGKYVLVGEDGAPFLDFFKEKAYKIIGKSWVNNHAHILKAKEQITIDDFVLHYLNSINYREYVNGTTRLKLTKGSLIEIPFLYPTKPIQQAIVSKIEELFSELDKGIEQLKTARQQLKTYRQAVLKWAFEGRLTNENVKEGELPGGWKITKLGEVIEKPKYGTSKKCEYEVKGIGVLRIPNIARGIVDSSDLKYAFFDKEEIQTYRLKEGDLLTIRSNGSVDLVGRCALITKKDESFLYAGYLIRLRPFQNIILPKYLIHMLSSINLRNQIERKAKSTSGVNNINSEELAGLVIVIPPIKEQHNIVQVIESRLSVSDKMEESITQSLQKAEALRQRILKKAFEGRLVK